MQIRIILQPESVVRAHFNGAGAPHTVCGTQCSVRGPQVLARAHCRGPFSARAPAGRFFRPLEQAPTFSPTCLALVVRAKLSPNSAARTRLIDALVRLAAHWTLGRKRARPAGRSTTNWPPCFSRRGRLGCPKGRHKQAEQLERRAPLLLPVLTDWLPSRRTMSGVRRRNRSRRWIGRRTSRISLRLCCEPK